MYCTKLLFWTWDWQKQKWSWQHAVTINRGFMWLNSSAVPRTFAVAPNSVYAPEPLTFPQLHPSNQRNFWSSSAIEACLESFMPSAVHWSLASSKKMPRRNAGEGTRHSLSQASCSSASLDLNENRIEIESSSNQAFNSQERNYFWINVMSHLTGTQGTKATNQLPVTTDHHPRGPGTAQECHDQWAQHHLGWRMVGSCRGSSAAHHPFPCRGTGCGLKPGVRLCCMEFKFVTLTICHTQILCQVICFLSENVQGLKRMKIVWASWEIWCVLFLRLAGPWHVCWCMDVRWSWCFTARKPIFAQRCWMWPQKDGSIQSSVG